MCFCSSCFFWLINSEAEEFFLHEVLIFGLVFLAVIAAQSLVAWLTERLAGLIGGTKASTVSSSLILFAFTVANVYYFCFGEFTLANYAVERIGMANAGTTGSDWVARFQSKPNVYAISFESLVSPYALQLLYDRPEQPHFDYLRERGFRVIDRAFSAGSATISSPSRVLDFDVEMENKFQMRSVFGHLNTTYKVFKDNDYLVNFIYKTNTWARTRAMPITSSRPRVFRPVIGAWTTRGMVRPEITEGNDVFSAKEVLTDRHGVALAIYPETFCEERIRENASTLLLVENLIACLSGEDSMTDAEYRREQQIYFAGKRTDLDDLLDEWK